jgi:hypothetical protein
MKNYWKLIYIISDIGAFGCGIYYAHQGNVALTLFWSIQSLILYFKINKKED